MTEQEKMEWTEMETALRARIAELEDLAYVRGAKPGTTERDYRERIVQDFQRISREKNDLKADFHRIAEAVLGDIHEGEATADDVIKYVKEREELHNHDCDRAEKAEAALDAQSPQIEELYKARDALTVKVGRLHEFVRWAKKLDEHLRAHHPHHGLADRLQNRADALLPQKHSANPSTS